jgi:hypothetical protein
MDGGVWGGCNMSHLFTPEFTSDTKFKNPLTDLVTVAPALGRLRRRRIDNIKMDLFRDRIECCKLNWSGSG